MEIIDYAVTKGKNIHRVDAEQLEPPNNILPSMFHDDELVLVAKSHIRQVLSLALVSLS